MNGSAERPANGARARVKASRTSKKASSAVKITEDQLQESVAKLLAVALFPEVVWSHLPAGGYILGRKASARLLRLGLKAGLPDIMIWWRDLDIPFGTRCIGLELKTESGTVSESQARMHDRLGDCGVPVYVCRSGLDVLDVLEREGVPCRKLLTEGRVYGSAISRATKAAAASIAKGPVS